MTATSTPLIDIEDKQPDEAISIKVRPELARDLRAYGEYAQGSSVSHVVTAALKRLFRDDKGFKSFKDSHPSTGETNSGFLRRGKAKSSNKPTA